MTAQENQSLLMLIRKADKRLQAELASLPQRIQGLQTDLEQIEEAIESLQGCAPSAILDEEEYRTHRQFDLSDQPGASTNDFLAPLLLNRRRLHAELADCQRVQNHVCQDEPPPLPQERIDLVYQLVTHWVFDEINRARRARRRLVTVPLEQRPTYIGQLVVEVLNMAPSKHGLSCRLTSANEVVIEL